MVERRHDDLVTRPPVLRDSAREVVGQLGHAAAEDDAAGIGAKQIRHRLPRRDDDPIGAPLGRRQLAAVCDSG